jgi:hypothetical protein
MRLGLGGLEGKWSQERPARESDRECRHIDEHSSTVTRAAWVIFPKLASVRVAQRIRDSDPAPDQLRAVVLHFDGVRLRGPLVS